MTICSRTSAVTAIDSEAHALSGYLRRLDEINRDALTGIERLEHRMLTAHLQSRMFELEAVRTWERNPQFYSDLLASSLAGQTLFTHAPAAERARRVLSKLRQTPRLIQAARDNIKDPPGIFVKVGIETMRGTLKFIDDGSAARLRGRRRPAPARRSRRRADRGVAGRRPVRRVLETDLAPKARASFRLGRDKFEQKLRLDEGITLPVDRLLAIATRELQATQEEFRSLAGKMNGGDRDGGVGEDEGAASRRRASSSPPAASSSTSSPRFSSARRSSRCRRASRSPSRRRPISIAGRSPACGPPARSRASRRAPTTT